MATGVPLLSWPIPLMPCTTFRKLGHGKSAVLSWWLLLVMILVRIQTTTTVVVAVGEYCLGPFFALLQASIVVSDTAYQVGVVCFQPQYMHDHTKLFPAVALSCGVSLLIWVYQPLSVSV
jgi:hypothetical protein